MKGTKCILIIEDDKAELEAIIRGFGQKAFAYKYDIKSARSAEECITENLHTLGYDVYIVDLWLPCADSQSFFGVKVIDCFAQDSPLAIKIAYSAHDEPEQFFRVAQRGATIFIRKRDCPPHELSRRVESLLHEQAKVQSREKQLDELAREHASEWKSGYSGKVIAVVEKKVVALGNNRLEALVQYERTRASLDYAQVFRHGGGWPEDPDLFEVDSV